MSITTNAHHAHGPNQVVKSPAPTSRVIVPAATVALLFVVLLGLHSAVKYLYVSFLYTWHSTFSDCRACIDGRCGRALALSCRCHRIYTGSVGRRWSQLAEAAPMCWLRLFLVGCSSQCWDTPV